MPKPSFLSAVPCAALAWMALLASACSSDTAGPAAGEQAMAGQVPGVFVDMQAIAQGSRPSIEQLQRVAIMDPDGFGQPMEMMTIQVPIGWVARGGVEWNRALECVPNTWELRWSAASHDGLFELSALPRLTWQVESAGLVPSNPCPGAPMASARQYLEYVVHNARRGARVLSYRERRDIVQAMTERAAQDARPQGAQIRFEAGELLIGYALHGQEMRESMVSAVTFSQVPGSVTAWAEGGMSLRAPDGLLDFALLEHVRRSSRVNRQWQQAVDAWGMERVRRHFAPQENSIQQWQQRRMHEVNTAGMAARHRIRGETIADIERINRRIVAGRNAAASERDQARAINAAQQVQPWRDPASAQLADFSSRYRHAWQLDDGRQFLTNDSGFEPARDLGINGRRLEPVR